MKYEEWIHTICKSADMSDEKQATDLVRFLLSELMENRDLADVEDKKLKEVMSAKDYEEWAMEAGKEVFKREVGRMEDGDFKSFIMENIDDLTDMEKILGENDGETFITL